jgi:hypothetical protein
MASGAVTQEPAFTGTMAPVLQTDTAWLWDRCEQLSEKTPICCRAIIAKPLFWRGTWRGRGRESTGSLPISPRRETAPGRSRGPLAAIRLIQDNAGAGQSCGPKAPRLQIPPTRAILLRSWADYVPQVAPPRRGVDPCRPSWQGCRAAGGPGRDVFARGSRRPRPAAVNVASAGADSACGSGVAIRTGWPTAAASHRPPPISAATPKALADGLSHHALV